MSNCLGCGAICPECAKRTERCLALYHHWPMETSLTAPALRALETLIRNHNGYYRLEKLNPVLTELANLANTISAHLQHKPVYETGPTDEELLS